MLLGPELLETKEGAGPRCPNLQREREGKNTNEWKSGKLPFEN